MKISFKMLYLSYTLFLICIVIYEFSQYDFTLFLQPSNETVLIEQALERIPICNSYDRRRQRSLLQTLQAWTHLAHSSHIRYWISHRTLNDFHQQQGLLPYENEIDVTILAQETPQLFQIQKDNFSSIYDLQIHPQWMMAQTSNRSYFSSQGVDFRKQNARFLNRQSNTSINIWPIYEKSPYNSVLIELDKNDQWKSIAEEWIFPLRPCRFSGIKVWCPAQPNLLTLSSDESESVYCSHGRWIQSNKQYLSK